MTSSCTRSSIIGSFLRENPSAHFHRLFFIIDIEARGKKNMIKWLECCIVSNSLQNGVGGGSIGQISKLQVRNGMREQVSRN